MSAVPTGGVELLPPDLAALNVVKAASVADQLYCSFRRSHADRPATAMCAECAQRMCVGCVEDHAEMPSCASHTTTSLEAGKALAPSLLATDPLCPSHSGKKLEYFCTADGCKVAACADCVITRHKGDQHALITAGEAAAVQSAAIRAAVMTVAAAGQRLRGTTAAVMQRAQAVTARAAAAEADIHRTCNNIVEAVRSREQALCAEVQAAARAKHKNLDIQRDGLLMLQQHIERAQQHSADVLSLCSGAQIVATAGVLLKRCEQLIAEAAAEPAEPVVGSAIVVDVEAAAALIASIGTLGAVTDSALNASCFTLRLAVVDGARAAAVGGAGAAAVPAAAVPPPPLLQYAGDKAVLVVECNTAALEADAPANLQLLFQRAVAACLRVHIPPKLADKLQCSAPQVAADGRSLRYTLMLRSDYTGADADVGVPITYRDISIRGSPCAIRLVSAVCFMPALSVSHGDVGTSHPAPNLVKFTGQAHGVKCHALGSTQMNVGKWQWTFEFTEGTDTGHPNLFFGCTLVDQRDLQGLYPYDIGTGIFSCSTGSYNRGAKGQWSASVPAATGTRFTFVLDFTGGRGGVLTVTAGGTTAQLFSGLQGSYRPYCGCYYMPAGVGSVTVKLLSQRQLA